MGRVSVFSSIVLAGLLAGCQGRTIAARAPDGPVYVCRHTQDAPVVDGSLGDAAWKKADLIHLVHSDGSGAPRQPTVVRALWSDTYLFLAFDCTDTDIWAGLDKHDSAIYEEEVVEVFLNDNADRREYVELEVSPNNTTFDTLILNPGSGKKFKTMLDYECTGWKTAVKVDGTVGRSATPNKQGDHRWTVEMAIPMDQLYLAPHHPPLTGDRWCWNLFRIDRPAGDRSNHEFTCWSPPLKPSFHTPERFGYLEFAN